MDAKSIYRYARISAFKVRDVTRAITGLSASEAQNLLKFTPKKGAVLVQKTLNSAIANAENNFALNASDLFVKAAYVDEGPTLKRHTPRARGSASPIRKRTAHITVVLSDDESERPVVSRNRIGRWTH